MRTTKNATRKQGGEGKREKKWRESKSWRRERERETDTSVVARVSSTRLTDWLTQWLTDWLTDSEMHGAKGNWSASRPVWLVACERAAGREGGKEEGERGGDREDEGRLEEGEPRGEAREGQ